MTKIGVKVQSRKGIVWQGEGTSCSLINSLGTFDILVEHTQFVTPIQDKIVVRNGEQKVWEYQLPSDSMCRVKNNLVEIWVGI